MDNITIEQRIETQYNRCSAFEHQAEYIQRLLDDAGDPHNMNAASCYDLAIELLEGLEATQTPKYFYPDEVSWTEPNWDFEK